MSNDALCRHWTWWKDVRRGKGIKVVRKSWLKYKRELKRFLFFSPRPTSEGIINPDDIGLCYCSSVPSAIDFAIQAGCKKVFLLGVDHKAIDEKHHFWQFFPRYEQPRQLKPAQEGWSKQQEVFPLNIKAYKALKEFADYKKCKIYNCNPESKVDVFEKIKFGEIADNI